MIISEYCKVCELYIFKNCEGKEASCQQFIPTVDIRLKHHKHA